MKLVAVFMNESPLVKRFIQKLKIIQEWNKTAFIYESLNYTLNQFIQKTLMFEWNKQPSWMNL